MAQDGFDFGNHLTPPRSKGQKEPGQALHEITGVDTGDFLENFVRDAGPYRALRKGTSQFWYLETVDGSELPKGLGGLWTDAASLLGALKTHLELEAKKNGNS